MNIDHLSFMPNLSEVLKWRGSDQRSGICFHLSAAMVLDVPASELCIGIFRAATKAELKEEPNASPEPFYHAWVEYEGSVFSPSMLYHTQYRFTPMIPEKYYQVNGARDIRKIDRLSLLLLSHKIGLESHFKYGWPLHSQLTVGGELLKAVGFEYKIGRLGGCVPLTNSYEDEDNAV